MAVLPGMRNIVQAKSRSSGSLGGGTAITVCGFRFLDTTSFSRSGSIGPLAFEGFTTAQAEWAADSVGQ